MEPQAECTLVLIGATPEGRKELLGFQVGVLDKLPKSVQAAAKSDLREIWTAPDRATAEAAIATLPTNMAPNTTRR